MRKNCFAILFFLFSYKSVFATWSIIMIDPQTKEIGIAGASCTPNCYGIGIIVPNLGAIVVQAMSNNEARRKGVQMIIAEAAPADIIEALRDPAFDPEKQQYAVVTIKYINEPATYTGTSNQLFNGALTDSGVSVQGNTLTDSSELRTIMDAVQKGRKNQLHIADVLMTALEAGSMTGGDKRCGGQKASSAFLTVAKPDGKKPYLDLVIFGQQKGGQNAVHLLRKKYDKWKRNKR